MKGNSHLETGMGRRRGLTPPGTLVITIVLSATLMLAIPVASSGRIDGAPGSGRGPGSRYEEVLSWDDGTAESIVTGQAGMKLAQYFQAPAWATDLVAVEFFIADDGVTNPNDPNAPTTEPFVVWVWSPGVDGLPGAQVNVGYVPFGYAECPEDTTVRMYLPEPIDLTDQDVFPDKKFFVGLEWDHRNNPYIGVDLDSPPGCSYRWNWSEWELRPDVAMIRAVVSVGGTSQPQVIYVDASGGGDYLTIQEAVSAAGELDTLMVAPGTYSGALNRGITFGGKSLTMVAQDGRSETMIDCGGLDRGFLFIDGEDERATVSGFTVRNGLGSGGGIRCVNSWPTIVDCAFIDCDGDGYGGGVYCNNAVTPSPTFTGCVFGDNTASVLGGGAALDFSDADFEECTFAGNSAADGGGVHCGAGSSPTFERCIVAFGEDGGAAYCSPTSMPTFHNCCVFGNAGGDDLCGAQLDNLLENPLFCDPAAGDYRLMSGSPCLPSGNPWGVQIGALGEGCEITPVTESTWGAIKALYR